MHRRRSPNFNWVPPPAASRLGHDGRAPTDPRSAHHAQGRRTRRLRRGLRAACGQLRPSATGREGRVHSPTVSRHARRQAASRAALRLRAWLEIRERRSGRHRSRRRSERVDVDSETAVTGEQRAPPEGERSPSGSCFREKQRDALSARIRPSRRSAVSIVDRAAAVSIHDLAKAHDAPQVG